MPFLAELLQGAAIFCCRNKKIPVRIYSNREFLRNHRKKAYSSSFESVDSDGASGSTLSADKDTTTTAAVVTTTDKSTTTSNAATTTTQDIGEVNYGDVNVNGVVDLTDAILLNKFLAGVVQLTDIQYANANCDQTDGTDNVGELDTTALMRFVLNMEGYQNLPYIEQD